MCSYLKCPDDLSIMLWLFGISVIVSLFVLIRLKNKALALLVLSILSGGILFLVSVSGSFIFRIYSIEWLQYFALFIWPIINIILVVLYVRKKKQ